MQQATFVSRPHVPCLYRSAVCHRAIFMNDVPSFHSLGTPPDPSSVVSHIPILHVAVLSVEELAISCEVSTPKVYFAICDRNLRRQELYLGVARCWYVGSPRSCVLLTAFVVMGTGVVSSLLHNFPYHNSSNGLKIVAVTIFILNLFIFIFVTTCTVLRYTKYPEVAFPLLYCVWQEAHPLAQIWSKMIAQPSRSLYIACFPMGIITLIDAALVSIFLSFPRGCFEEALTGDSSRLGLWWPSISIHTLGHLVVRLWIILRHNIRDVICHVRYGPYMRNHQSDSSTA